MASGSGAFQGQLKNGQEAWLYWSFTQNAALQQTTLTLDFYIKRTTSTYSTYKNPAPFSISDSGGVIGSGNCNYRITNVSVGALHYVGSATKVYQHNEAGNIAAIGFSAYLDLSGTSVGSLSVSGSLQFPAIPETGVLTPHNYNEAQSYVTLSGIIASVPWARTINWWYKLSTAASYTLMGQTTIPANSAQTSWDGWFSALIPGQTYNFMVEIAGRWYGVTSITQPAASGSFSYSSKLETSIIGNITGLFASPGYSRTATWKYKKTTSGTWLTAGTTTIANGASSGSYTYTGLEPESSYDFRCEISAGLLYLTLNILDIYFPSIYEDFPVGVISQIVQLPFTDTIRVYWTANDPSPDARFQLFMGGTPPSSVGELLEAVPAAYSEYLEVSAGSYTFAIQTTNVSEAGEVMGAYVSFVVEESDFSFNPALISGAPVVSAAEWARFRAWCLAKFDVINLTLTEAEQAEFDRVFSRGNIITAAHFNLIGSGIGTALAAKAAGDALLAADFMQLATELNALTEL